MSGHGAVGGKRAIGGSGLISLSASTLAEKLQSGEVSSVEVTQAHLDRIAEVDGDIHAFLHISRDALATAAEVDGARKLGAKLSPLAGVPVAIKDVLCTQDMPSTAGSRMLEGWIPPYDATVVAKLRGLFRSARPTWMSLRWGPRLSIPLSVRPITRGIWSGSPAVPVAVLPPLLHHSKHRSLSAATRVARSANPHRSPERLA